MAKGRVHLIQLLKGSAVVFIGLLLLCQCQSAPDGEKSKENCEDEKCCEESSTANSETSEISCPECGFTKTETLPTDVCAILYNCDSCGYEMTPKEGDCCVYCTYGTHKCPSMQDE